MKKLILTLYIGTQFLYTSYCVDYDYIFSDQKSITPQSLNANFDTVRYLLNKANKEIEKTIKEGDYRLRWNQRGAINAENITTQNGYDGSANNLQDVLSNQIYKLNVFSNIISTMSGGNTEVWSTYPATSTVNMNGYGLFNVSSITANVYGIIRSSNIYSNNIINNGFINASSISVTGNINGTFLGNGSGLTNLDAGDIDAGVLPRVRGGTNNITYTNGGLIAYDSGSDSFVSTYSATSISTSGHTHTLNDLGGILAISHGGTNKNTYANYSIPTIDPVGASFISVSTFCYKDGNLGIGTAGPQQVFHIVDTHTSGANLIQGMRVEGNGGNYFDIGRGYNDGALSIQGSQTGNNNIVLAPTSGNVGIGTTSPTSKLSVEGDIATTLQLKSTIATGTAPLTVNSTTKVTNLNADYIEGCHITSGISTLLTIGGTLILDYAITYGITYNNAPTVLLTWQGISGNYYKQNIYIKEAHSTSGATYSVSLTSLTGGVSSSAAAGDLVIVVTGWSSAANGDPGVNRNLSTAEYISYKCDVLFNFVMTVH